MSPNDFFKVLINNKDLFFHFIRPCIFRCTIVIICTIVCQRPLQTFIIHFGQRHVGVQQPGAAKIHQSRLTLIMHYTKNSNQY
jgi:hypothetical protein